MRVQRRRGVRAVLQALAAAVQLAACQSDVNGILVSALVLTPDSLSLKVNASLQIVASVLDQQGAQVTGASVSFTSRNPAIATTTPGGLVTAVAAGITTIVAQSGSHADSVPVVVSAAGPIIVTLLDDSLAVAAGTSVATVVQTVQDGMIVAAPPLTYTSSDTAVFTISGNGVVTGRSSGFGWARVSAGGSSDSLRVTTYRDYTGTLQPTVTLTGGAWGLALSGTVLYTSQVASNTIRRLDLPGFAAAGTITVGSSPVDVTFSANGQRAWAVSTGSNELAVIDVAAGTAALVPVGETPWRVVPSKDQSRVYVTTTTGTLRIFDAATGAPITSYVATSGAANGAALSADGSRLYLAAFLGGQVAEVTTATNAVRAATVGQNLQEIVISPDGSELYVASEGGRMLVLSAATLAPTDSIAVTKTFGLMLTPDGRFLVATSAVTNQVFVIDRLVRRVVRTFSVINKPRRVLYDAATASILVSSQAGGVEVIR